MGGLRVTPKAEELIAVTSPSSMAKLKAAAARFRPWLWYFDAPDGRSKSRNIAKPATEFDLWEMRAKHIKK